MITNTSKNPRPDWLFGLNPNAIKRQEAKGQEELVEGSKGQTAQLPARGNCCDALAYYEELGINVLGPTPGDDLFVMVELPEGWKIERTDHSMWSNLVNAKGEEVTSIFYKAAFYDRDAFINRKD